MKRIRSNNSEDEANGSKLRKKNATFTISQYVQHRYGAFKNYYFFNPVNERLKFLTKDVIEFIGLDRSVKTEIRVCDLGCNSGDLTMSLYRIISEHHKNKTCKILGIDLDEDLVNVAIEKLGSFDPGERKNIEFKVCDIMSNQNNIVINQQYDLISCFGLTMWIHINHGDEGLEQFLCKISKQCTCLMIEPHPWKTYRKAAKRLRKCTVEAHDSKNVKNTFEHLSNLKHRGQDILDHIHNIITRNGFEKRMLIGKTKWGRHIFVYKKTDTVEKK